MVAGAAERADTIVARGKSSGHGGGETTLAVSGVVDAFEESELRWIERLLGCQRAAEILHRHVCVTDDLSVVHLLRGSVTAAS